MSNVNRNTPVSPLTSAHSGNDPSTNDPSADAAEEVRWVELIRSGDEAAWRKLIDCYEGRLLAYVHRRLVDRSVSEDIVQETFVGFLVSLPNYDPRRRLENYLFSICSYKLTDHLRASGRRPTLPLMGRGESFGNSGGLMPIAGHERVASSIARSAERQDLEQTVVADAIAEQIQRWRETDNLIKLKAIELIFVGGAGNIEVAEKLNLTQQQVANLKSDFITRLKAIIARQELDSGVFPELVD